MKSRVLLKIAITAAALLGVGFSAWVLLPRYEISRGLRELRQAYSDERPIRVRVLGFGHAPLATNRELQDQPVNKSRDNAEGILLNWATRNNAVSHHALGQLYLLRRDLRTAVLELRRAVDADPENARFASDLGAALLEKGCVDRQDQESDKATEELAESLRYLNKAVELDTTLMEPQFNRALCYEELRLWRPALDEWHGYLEKDGDSGWAQEANQYLGEDEHRGANSSLPKDQLWKAFLDAYDRGDEKEAWNIIGENRDAITGRLIWWSLLDDFCDQVANRHGDEAGRALGELSFVGSLELKKAKDPYVAELARFCRRLSGNRLTAFCRAHALMNDANSAYVGSDYDDAIRFYRQAESLFGQVGDRWEAEFAGYWVGFCTYVLKDRPKTLQILSRIADDAGLRGHKWLLELALNVLGNVQTDRDELSSGFEYTQRAVATAESIGDTFGIQKNLSQLAYKYADLGDYHHSLACIQRSLDIAATAWPGARQIWRTYDTAIRVLILHGAYDAAAEYGKEALREALENTNENQFRYLSYVRLAVLSGKLNRYSEGLQAARSGLEVATTLSPEALRQEAMSYCYLRLGELYTESGQFDAAMESYAKTIPIHAYETHRGMLQCKIGQGDHGSAKSELATVLNMSESYRPKITDDEKRSIFFDVQQSIYDVAVDFNYFGLRDRRAAFEYCEQSRARSLLDLASSAKGATEASGGDPTGPPPIGPLSLTQIQDRLPVDAEVLQYAVLNDKVVIWAISKNDFDTAWCDIKIADLNEKVKRYLELLTSPSAEEEPELLEAGRELYRILISTAEGFLDREKTICIVPDKILNYLPFHALVSGKGNYMVDDYLVEYAPSATIFLTCTDSAQHGPAPDGESFLAVANPSFDRRLFPLANLVDAEGEARTISSFYKGGRTLINSDAREERVKQEMELADVIHLASHYVVDERSPMFSKLLLSKEPGAKIGEQEPDGVLEAREIYAMDLSKARLVVLSACQTGVERYYNGEGMVGMSRTFLARRVPLVVASLWAADSWFAALLMANFHQYRRLGGLSTVKALRLAQREMADRKDGQYHLPYYWAAFSLFGGQAEF